VHATRCAAARVTARDTAAVVNQLVPRPRVGAER
jgi:hypothetical protein